MTFDYDNKEHICGIYCIKNIINNKVYIGQSVNIKHRFNDHYSALKNNRHDNTYLQHSFNKYGDENFIFFIICECTKDKLDDLEKYYIKQYNSMDRNNGFNRDGGGSLYKIVTEETRKKISIAGKKRFLNPEEREKDRTRAIERFKNKSEHIKCSLCQKKRYENPSQVMLNSELRKKFYTTEKGKENIKKYKETMLSKYWSNKEWCNEQRENRKNRILIMQLNLDMSIVKEWSSLRQINKEINNFYRQPIKECLNNTYGLLGNGYKNFIWIKKDNYLNLSKEEINEYIKKYKNYDFEESKKINHRIKVTKHKIVQMDLDYNFIKMWNSAGEIHENLHISRSAIIRHCKKETESISYKGFIWMYDSDYFANSSLKFNI